MWAPQQWGAEASRAWGNAELTAATRAGSCCLHVSQRCEKPSQVVALRQGRLIAWSTRDLNAASICLPPPAPAAAAGLARWDSAALCKIPSHLPDSILGLAMLPYGKGRAEKNPSFS